MSETGNHRKLKITAYENATFTTKGKDFTAMLNPEAISVDYTVEYNKEQAAGSPDTCVKYKKTPPTTIKFELILDGTGVVDPEKTDVEAELDALKSVVYTYNGSSHQPNFVKIEFAEKSAYTCRLSSMSTNITRFRANGSFLRAKVSLTFIEVQLESQSKGAQSPDMTHNKIVSAGDLLPKLTQQVYDDENHLLKVAAYNKLDSLLYLQPGQEILFPPLSNQ